MVYPVWLCWILNDRETTNSYTIAANPNLSAILRTPSVIYTSFTASKSIFEADGKTPLISHEALDRISRLSSTWSEKAALYKQLTGEFPIASGCSFTQTVFNGVCLLSHWLTHHIHIFESFALNANTHCHLESTNTRKYKLCLHALGTNTNTSRTLLTPNE